MLKNLGRSYSLEFKNHPIVWEGIGYYELIEGEWELVSRDRPVRLSWFQSGIREYVSRLKIMNWELAPAVVKVSEKTPPVQKVMTGKFNGKSFLAYVPDGQYAPQTLRCKRAKPSPDKIKAMRIG